MHHKQNNKESKTYVQGLRPFGNTLPRGVKGILKKNGYNYSEIISKWSILVGKNISKYAFPSSIKISKEGKDGTLILAVKRGDEINVEYSKTIIINKINSFFGYNLINNIRIQIINKKIKNIKNKNLLTKLSRNFEQKINEIKSTNIRSSLSQLIKAIQDD
tara:strand:+ start:125 stop:607 length:483 start_codon:yes stop_codon:yes gene_type:complete